MNVMILRSSKLLRITIVSNYPSNILHGSFLSANKIRNSSTSLAKLKDDEEFKSIANDESTSTFNPKSTINSKKPKTHFKRPKPSNLFNFSNLNLSEEIFRMKSFNRTHQYRETIAIFNALSTYKPPLNPNRQPKFKFTIEMVNLGLLAYLRLSLFDEFWLVYNGLNKYGVDSNEFTWTLTLNCCLSQRNWDLAETIYETNKNKLSLESISVAQNLYLKILITQNQPKKALDLLTLLESKNNINKGKIPLLTYENVIQELCHHGHIRLALIVYQSVIKKEFIPTLNMIDAILVGFAKLDQMNAAHQFYTSAFLPTSQLLPNSKVIISMINGAISTNHPELGEFYLQELYHLGHTSPDHVKKLWDRLFHLVFSTHGTKSEGAIKLLGHLRSHFEMPPESITLSLNLMINDYLIAPHVIPNSDELDVKRITNQKIDEFIDLYKKDQGIEITPQALTIIAQRLCQAEAIKAAFYILNLANNLYPNQPLPLLYTVLVKNTFQSNQPSLLRQLTRELDRSNHLTPIVYATLIRGYSRSTIPNHAFKVYKMMRERGYQAQLYPALRLINLAYKTNQLETMVWLIQDALGLGSHLEDSDESTIQPSLTDPEIKKLIEYVKQFDVSTVNNLIRHYCKLTKR